MLSALIAPITSIIDKLIPDPQAKLEANLKLIALQQEGGFKELEAAMNVIVAESKSEHWIVAAWRPITMLTFVAIIANNYLLYPYLSLFWHSAPLLELPPDLWELLKIGLGGYVVGRSVEKAVGAYKGGSK
tara:strand:+ start:15055 stop:15447 length:393 start_codon:yes stop_codon:yes gene_type:complete